VTKNYVVDYLSIANRDIFVTEAGSFTQRYVYDASGTRISAEFDYADGTARGTTNSDGEYGENFQSDFAAERVEKVWYRTSLLGSTLFAVDAAGDVIAHAIYDPWGAPITETYTDSNFSGIENLTNFTGYTWDEVLGLYFAQNRFYDAETHRFTQEDPIKDGTNWYVYCGNEPLMRVDPWGLKPMWNEPNDHWFALRDEIESVGGFVVNWDRNTATAQVAVYGKTVFFKAGTTGVKIESDSKMYVRADTFYSKVVTAATEMIFLGVHEVVIGIGTGNYHTSTIIFASKKSNYYDTEEFAKNGTLWGDVRYATIGAGPGTSASNKLQSDVNREKDVELHTKVEMRWLYSGTAYTQALFYAEAHYRTEYNNLNYDFLPNADKTSGYGKGYNSNSFTVGLLKAVGLNPGALAYKVPGWDKPVPSEYFGY